MTTREKGKRILLVSHELTYSGAPRSLLNMAVLLKNQGCYVEIWSLMDGDFSKEISKENIRLRLIDDLKTINYDEVRKFHVVILNTFFTAHLVQKMQRSVRTILYIREAQNIPELANVCNQDEGNIRRANEIICVSEYAQEFIKNRYSPKNIRVIHNFVNDVYDGSLNIVKNNTIHFIISGTCEYRKGYDMVLEAFNHMPKELQSKTRLHLVGRKPEWARKYWELLQKKYNYRIIDHGEIKDRAELMRLYKQMNVFVIASRDESCSLVALEGAMLGKALIMSENVGAQYLDEKRKGIYKTEDAGELCRKMCELTSRRELLIRGIEMRKSYKRTSTAKIYTRKLKEYI